MIRFGQHAGLSFELSLESPSALQRGDEATFGRMAVWLGENLVWGRLGPEGHVLGVEWYWIELLEHLSANWSYLEHEQGYPFGVKPFRPSGMMVELARRWRSGGPEIDAETEDSTARAFEASHNLALALTGCLVPDLWIVHEGRQSLIEAKGAFARVERRKVVETLKELGEYLVGRVATLNDPRSVLATTAWHARDQQPFEQIAATVTKLNREALVEIAGPTPLREYFQDVRSDSPDENVILDLVYRCKGQIAHVPLRRLIEKCRESANGDLPLLDEISRRWRTTLEELRASNMAPHQQGRKLALLLREFFFGERGVRAEPEAILNLLGVSLERWSLDSQFLDAVAVWGNRLAPWIVVNLHEKHLANQGAERATIAHEICHLLFDRSDVLPCSAIVGGVMDREAEQRANSFAAEFLCPRFALSRIFDDHLSARRTIEIAVATYGVSKELAAFQLARSNCELTEADRREIELLVSQAASLPWR